MAFDRKTINAILKDADITIPADVLNSIFKEHTDSMDTIKIDLQSVKGDLNTVTKERDELKDAKPTGTNTEEYERLKKEYEDFKQGIEQAEANKKLSAGITEALKKANFSESVLDLLAKDKAFEAVKLNDKGEIEGLEEAVKTVTEQRAGLVVKQLDSFGNPVSTQTTTNNGKNVDDMSMDEYVKYREGK